jgi:hypothetical protein
MVYLCKLLATIALMNRKIRLTPLDLLAVVVVPATARMRRKDGSLMGATPAEVGQTEAVQREGLGAAVCAEEAR